MSQGCNKGVRDLESRTPLGANELIFSMFETTFKPNDVSGRADSSFKAQDTQQFLCKLGIYVMKKLRLCSKMFSLLLDAHLRLTGFAPRLKNYVVG